MTLMLSLVMFLTVTASVEARQQQAGGSPVIATRSRTFRAPTDDEVGSCGQAPAPTPVFVSKPEN